MEKITKPLCDIDTCLAVSTKSGFCEKHYRTMRRKGLLGWDGAFCNSEDECKNPALSKGLCNKHYNQKRKEGTQCSVDGCVKVVLGNGLCSAHYKRMKLYGDVNAYNKPVRQECKVQGCEEKQAAHELCDTHYRRFKKIGRDCIIDESFVYDPAKYYRICDWCGNQMISDEKILKMFCTDDCAKHKEKYRSRNRHLLRQFDLTVDEWDDLFESQNECCGICKQTDPGNGKEFAVDHNHETGAVRGILCSGCNTGIGLLKDDPETLRSAIAYLEKCSTIKED